MEEESESFGGGEDWKSTQLVCFRSSDRVAGEIRVLLVT
jgi:hypothetical protein